MFGLGWTEILVILGVALLVLGPSKLPQIAKGLGRGIRDFRRAVNSLEDDPPPPKRASSQSEMPDPIRPPPEPASLQASTEPDPGPPKTADKPEEDA